MAAELDDRSDLQLFERAAFRAGHRQRPFEPLAVDDFGVLPVQLRRGFRHGHFLSVLSIDQFNEQFRHFRQRQAVIQRDMRGRAFGHLGIGGVDGILGYRDAAVPFDFKEAERPVVQLIRQDHAYGTCAITFRDAAEQQEPL